MKKKKKEAAIMVGDTLKLSCISKGAKGDGIFKKDGLVIFVPDVDIDKKYRIKITRIMARYAFGEVV